MRVVSPVGGLIGSLLGILLFAKAVLPDNQSILLRI
jgi:hypothetical protein